MRCTPLPLHPLPLHPLPLHPLPLHLLPAVPQWIEFAEPLCLAGLDLDAAGVVGGGHRFAHAAARQAGAAVANAVFPLGQRLDERVMP
jgi:hypothetical protein